MGNAKKTKTSAKLWIGIALVLTFYFSAFTLSAKMQSKDEDSLLGANSFFQQLREDWARFTGNIEEDEENDADIPPFARGKISKDNYLQLRAAYIARLRGIDSDKPFDPKKRSEAIKQMEVQESRISKDGISELSASGNEVLAGGTWTFIGPAFLPNGQTTSVSTAVSGRVTAIDVDPTNSDIAYVGTAQGGVFRTTDGGATWTPLMDSAQSLAVGAIAVAPSDPSKVYIGTGEGNDSGDSFFGVGIYRIDNANTASPTLVGPLNKNASNNDVFTGIAITKILVHPTNPDVIFASTTLALGGIGGFILPTRPIRGLFRSTNATQTNATFTRLPITTANGSDRRVFDMVLEPGNPNNLVLTVGGFTGSVAAPDGGVYISTNAQAAIPTFTRVLTIGTNSIFRANLAINKVGDTTTVLVASGEPIGGLLRSSTNIFSGSPTFSQLTAANGFCGAQCFYDVFVTMDPNNASIIYLGGSANSGSAAASGRASVFQRSIDGGATFTRIDTGLHADSHAFVITPTNLARGYFGSDGGVWRSDNVNTANVAKVAWTSLNNSTFSAIQFQSIAVHPIDPNYTFGGTQDNGTELRRPDGTWVRADSGDGGFAVIDQNATDTSNVTIYHTYYNQVNNLLAFTRADLTAGGFTNFFGCFNGSTNNGINCNDTAALFYAPLVGGPGNPNTIYYGTDRLYRTADRGVTATVVSQAPFTAGVPISAIGISPQNDNVRVVGLANGKVFATSSGSTTMTDVSNGLPATYVSRAVVDPHNQTTAYLTFADFNVSGGPIWQTTNLNAPSVTWTAIPGMGANRLPNIPVNAFVVDPQNSNLLYAGTDIGVYFSQDSGRNWFPFATGLPRVAVFDMAITANHKLRIATHGRGMWETQALAPRRADFDFDGDGKADVSVFRPSNGIWYLLNSQSGFGGIQFGASGDKLVPADYDGDGKTDVAVFRNDTWYIQRSTLGFTNVQFGQAGDIPIPADYDADGKTDIAVYRPSSGTWFLQRSTLGFTGIQFGIDGDIPIATDFDGDGKADLAVFRPSNGIWYILGSTQGFYGLQFGAVGDKLVPADYDGDGKTDIAVFRPSTATWYINRSQLGFTSSQFGISTDIPVPADYDGDGKADLAVYRNDTWFIQRSTAGFTGVQFGGAGDQPVPNAFVR